MDNSPLITVIVPVHNSSTYIDQCLEALISSTYKSYEIIVVDDCSTDDSAEISRKKGAIVHRLPHKSGPAAARNHGARCAAGDILFFVDSDVVVQEGTLERAAGDLLKNKSISAVFGSYDDSPAVKDNLSQFRNLFHHFIHQNSEENSITFWAGCGAIYRDIFSKLGGFDEHRYNKPSIEDIELGFRMHKAGHQIMLDKDLQVKHLKKWNWGPLLKTDIFNRAVPWSKLIIESGFLPSDLNLKISHRISAVLVWLLTLLIFLFLLEALSLLAINLKVFFAISILVLLFILIFLNRSLYLFFLNKSGVKLTLFAIPMHFLYYLYSGLSFGLYYILNKFNNLLSTIKNLHNQYR